MIEQEIKSLYNDLDRLKKLNNVLSDRSFYEQRGYSLEDIPDSLLELSFPVRNPLPFLDKDDGYILDIGCGCGLDIYLVKKQFKNKKIVGMDISYSLLLEAKKIVKDLVCADAVEIPLKSNFFSTVFMNGVFNLINDKRKLISEVRRILLLSGIVFVADIYKEENIAICDDADLFNLGKALTLKELFNLFTEMGFEYEFGEYEKEVIPGFGIFSIKWRKYE